MSGSRIVWLAAADARGHLVRAHLARRLLAERGITADIVTTSDDGRRFLAALGTPCEVLSPHYGVAFDSWQNMDRRRTEACILRYFLQPSRGLHDLRRLHEIARGAAYVVNDFHPLLLLAGEGIGPVVHVYGASLYQAIARHFEGRGPVVLDRGFAELVRSLASRAHARVEHGLAAPVQGAFRAADATHVLPPLISLPARPREEVRAALGLSSGRKLAAVYLNPHFRESALAAALCGALEAREYTVYGIGEGLAGQRAFSAYDGSFADVASAADLLVSAPGMASCAQARAFDLPFVAIATDQPEQRTNLAALAASPRVAPVDLLDPSTRRDLGAVLGAAIDRAASSPGPARPDSMAAARAVHCLWTDLLAGLVPHASIPRPPPRGLPRHLRSEVRP